MIASHAYTSWITGNKLKLFDHLRVNQNTIYFNPTASEYTIPTLPTLPLFVPDLPSSRTHAILRWLDIIGITFPNISDIQTLWRGIQSVVDFLSMKKLQKDFNTTKNDMFDKFLS